MIHVLLPAYDEERALPRLIEATARALPAGGFRVLVVDDGSRDGTAALAERAASRHPVEVIRHARNRGLGAALATGLAALAPRVGAADWVATLDADGTHDPGLILRMREAGETRSLDLVIASRYARGGAEIGIPPHRRLLSRGASTFVRFAFRLPRSVRDTSSGFRLYRGELLDRLRARWGDRMVQERGFACMAELLLKAVAAGARVGEVPLVLRYDRKGGPSKMNIGRTIVGYLRLRRRLRGEPD